MLYILFESNVNLISKIFLNIFYFNTFLKHIKFVEIQYEILYIRDKMINFLKFFINHNMIFQKMHWKFQSIIKLLNVKGKC